MSILQKRIKSEYKELEISFLLKHAGRIMKMVSTLKSDDRTFEWQARNREFQTLEGINEYNR